MNTALHLRHHLKHSLGHRLPNQPVGLGVVPKMIALCARAILSGLSASPEVPRLLGDDVSAQLFAATGSVSRTSKGPWPTVAALTSGCRVAFAASNCALMIPSRRGDVCIQPSNPETGMEIAIVGLPNSRRTSLIIFTMLNSYSSVDA